MNDKNRLHEVTQKYYKNLLTLLSQSTVLMELSKCYGTPKTGAAGGHILHIPFYFNQKLRAFFSVCKICKFFLQKTTSAAHESFVSADDGTQSEIQASMTKQ